MEKAKSKGITGRIKTSLLYIYLILAMFLPFYSYTTNINNVTFILPNVVICLLIVSDIISNHGKLSTGGASKPYVLAFFILLVVSLYCNIRFNGLYWTTFNRLITIVFIIVLLRTEACNYQRIIEATVNIMCVAVLFSLILRLFFDIDCIYLQNFHVSLRRIGGFYDNRMTYVFIHKSGYGLVLILLLFLILWNQSLPHRRIKMVIVGIAIFFTSSAVSIGALFICLFEYLFSKREKSKNMTMIKIVLEILCIIIAYYSYVYLIDIRDLSSGGGRFYIWKAGIEALRNNPTGVGDEFYSTQFAINGKFYNNFHNVFINEMFHYSILEGVVYTFVTCLPFLIGIKKYKNKGNLIWGFIAVLFILSMDNALHDSFYTLFMYLGCVTFGFVQEQREYVKKGAE